MSLLPLHDRDVSCPTNAPPTLGTGRITLVIRGRLDQGVTEPDMEGRIRGHAHEIRILTEWIAEGRAGQIMRRGYVLCVMSGDRDRLVLTIESDVPKFTNPSLSHGRPHKLLVLQLYLMVAAGGRLRADNESRQVGVPL